MSEVGDIIADLVKAGVDAALVGRVASALAAREPVLVPDEQAERRRAADRERKRLRKSADSAERLPPKEKSPTPPKEITPNPFSEAEASSNGARASFAEFWTLFPNKVGKRDAEKAFATAIRRAPFEAIMAGLQRYVAKTDDRPWCNPATFLNQNRWEDQPAATPPRQATAPPKPEKPRNAGEAARQELMRRGLYYAPDRTPELGNESDGNSGFAGTDIARSIAIAASGGRPT